MNFDLSEEQVMLRDGVARFVRDAYGLEHRRHLAQTAEGFSRDHWKQYADLGWLALNLPEDVGGLGCSFIETLLLCEQFGHGLVLEPFLSTAVLCSHLIDRSGAEAHRQELLPQLISGDLLLALAHDEPGGRGNDLNVRTAAHKSGEGYVLSGRKIMALAAPSADRLIVSAALDGALALFLLPVDAAGLEIRPYPLVDGSRAADVVLDAVRLAPEALLVAGAAATALLAEALDRARLAAMAQAVGAMEACMEITSDYIKQRQQFGQTLARFQSLQHLMADMFVDTQQSRSMLYQGLATLDAEPARRRRAISGAKIVIGAAGKRVSGNGVQLHGGYGITDEYAISHYYRLLYVLDKLFGGVDDHIRDYELSSP